MVDSTLSNWICLLMLEEMALVAVGYANYRIPKDQMQEIEKCGQRKEMCVCTVRMENKLNPWWYVFFAMIASIGSIVYFSEYCCANLLWMLSHQRIAIGATEVALLIILFLVITALFLHAPFIGEKRAVYEAEKRCRIQYGVIIVFDR